MAGMKIRFIEKSTLGFYLSRNAKICVLLLTLSLSFPLLMSAMETSDIKSPIQAGTITDIAASQEGGILTITLKTDRVLEPQTYRLEDPPRLVLDFQNTVNRVPFMELPLDNSTTKQLRISQFRNEEPKIARLVLDLEKDHVAHEIILNKDSVKVTIHEEESEENMPEIQTTLPSGNPVATETSSMPQSANRQETDSNAVSNNMVSDPREVPPLIASLSNPASTTQNIPSSNNTTSRFSGHLLTLDFVDLPLVDFFRVMSEEAGINIVLDPKVNGNISIKVEKLPWDQIFNMVLVNHSLDQQIEGNLIRVAHKSTLQEEARQKEALKKAELLAADLATRVKRLNYAKAATLLDALNDLKTVRGTVVHDERTNSLVLTDIPTYLDKMIELIITLDIPQPQVEIEARIVSASRDFARDIGIQFGFVKGNLERVTVGGPNTFGTIGGTRPSATPGSSFAAGNTLTGRGASDSTASESGAISTGGETGNYNVNLPAAKAFGGLGISIGNIFDTFLLDAALTAGESKGLAKLISQPKVTAQNNSSATISQGTRFPVLVRANNTTTVQFYNAALTLTVTPQITYEGNIVLDLTVENNTADWSRTVDNVPSIRISESQSRVLVSDGGTTVIGGILLDEDSNSGDKVPFLGDLPLVGNLFSRSSVSRSTQEVLFFVTPRIIN